MQPTVFIGVDVASTEVVAAWSDAHAPVRTLANEARALTTWLDTLPKDACLGVESTGPYHEQLVQLADERGLRVYLLNPRAVHHYAKAIHRGQKTDHLDARLIAHYIASEHTDLRVFTMPSKLEYQLLKLQRRRAKLVRVRTSVRLSMRDVIELADDTQELLDAFAQTIGAIDRSIAELLASDPLRTDLAQRLRSVPGFGPLNTNHFATLLPRIDPRNADACVAYLGLDLRARDSGRFHGHRKLTKHGPSEPRRLIYLAAQAAARSDPHWNALYLRLLEKGRSRIEATVIIARKLLKVAYHLYRYGGTYDRDLIAKNLGLAT